MLRQVYILYGENILYNKNFGKSLSVEDFQKVITEIVEEVKKGTNLDSYDFFKYKIVYSRLEEERLMFIFITDVNDEVERTKNELEKLKKEFLDTFGDSLESLDPILMEILNPIIATIHRNLKTKISLVGFSGVGKTTTTNLICADEIPSVHIPTITGKISTVKIGKLYFHLWDFAGQEQFSYLWNDFILGSDAVLIITNSSLENVEKSKFFIELIKEHAPYAHIAVIGNKQDLPEALNIDKIQEILGVKTYSMVAIDPVNRERMIQIIADILEINTNVSPLLKPLFERDQLINKARDCLENGDIAQTAEYFEKISDICLELGDDALYKEFYEKASKLKSYLTDN
ncbi:MAG: GTP-binding protein [Candidatus Lokiarchaeota archaeon]|nr:GTP-binding protein [Candidatus Lokiarchaeota archaeon]